MPARSAQVDAFWQEFRRHTGLDHDNYAVASFGDSPRWQPNWPIWSSLGSKEPPPVWARDYEGREPMPKLGDS